MSYVLCHPQRLAALAAQQQEAHQPGSSEGAKIEEDPETLAQDAV